MRRAILGAETKGNIPICQKPDSLKALPDTTFSESTKKLMELEYEYAKDNAVLAISQRSAMMQIYMAALGLVVTVSLAVFKDADSFFKNSPMVFCLGALGAVVSIYMMRGMVFLRSDWCDYVNSMAKIKLFFIRMEKNCLREEVLQEGLYHDPFHPPSRNLRTNFFYISYLFCCVVLFASLFLLSSSFISGLAYFKWIKDYEYLAQLTLLFGVGLVLVAIATANITWRVILRAKRPTRDLSPRFR